jgi:hypothetical protein
MKHVADLPSLELDDELVTYILEAQLGFDLLRRAATLLAGLMVLAAAGARGARGLPILIQAQEAAVEAAQSLAGIHVPTRAAEHHLHLTRAGVALSEALERSLESLRWNEDQLAAILPPLRACERELHCCAALSCP